MSWNTTFGCFKWRWKRSLSFRCESFVSEWCRLKPLQYKKNRSTVHWMAVQLTWEIDQKAKTILLKFLQTGKLQKIYIPKKVQRLIDAQNYIDFRKWWNMENELKLQIAKNALLKIVAKLQLVVANVEGIDSLPATAVTLKADAETLLASVISTHAGM